MPEHKNIADIEQLFSDNNRRPLHVFPAHNKHLIKSSRFNININAAVLRRQFFVMPHSEAGAKLTN